MILCDSMSQGWTHALTFWPNPSGEILGLVCSEGRPLLLMEKAHNKNELLGME